MPLGCLSKRVEHTARFDFADPPNRVYCKHAIEVLGKVDQNSDVATLSPEGGATASVDDRGAVTMTDLDSCCGVLNGARDDDPNRHLPIIRGIGGIKSSATQVETDFR